jgi:hypothetical protein
VQWIVALLGLQVLLSFLLFAFLVARIDALRQIQAGARTGEAVATVQRLRATGFITVVVLVATIVLWLVWQHRAHANLRALGAGNLRFTPGWAVGWWFTPFANVVFPYLTMRELVKASDPGTGAVDWTARRTPALLGVWWAAWLGRTVAGAIPSTIGGRVPTLPQLIQRDSVALVTSLITVAAAVLAMFVLREIDRRQTTKLARVSDYRSALASAR